MGIFLCNGKWILITLSLLVNLNLKAQDSIKPIEIKSLTKIRLTFFGVGLEREKIRPTTIYIFRCKYFYSLFIRAYVFKR